MAPAEAASRDPTLAARRISVIVPCFDAAETLGSCIEGLLAQEIPGTEVEFLIVDNNSHDETAAIARSFSGVNVLCETTQGSYAARNAGLRRARGEILAFIDPDCVPQTDWLLRLTEPLESPAVKIAIGRSLLAGGSLAMRTLQDYEHVKDGLILAGSDPELYYGHTNNMAVRREVFDTLGPFVERRRGGDVVCVRQCVDRWGCDSVQYAPHAEVVHLEMDGLATYYRKVFTYGWSHALYSRLIPARVAPPRQRWELFRRVCRDCGYSIFRQPLLLALMGLEGLAWRSGSRRGRTADAREPGR